MKSMTGFGKAMRVTDAYQIEVEIKSVNHRFRCAVADLAPASCL